MQNPALQEQGKKGMERRAALALLGTMFLTACGGGGGGTSAPDAQATTTTTAAAPVPEPAAAPEPQRTSNIALWGDSMTPGVAVRLQQRYPDREVYNGGVAGETSAQIAARQTSDTAGRNEWINIFWYGQNNQTQPDQIKADIAASVAALAPGNRRFLVLAVVNQAKPEESRGAPIHDTIVQLNNELAALYPDHYLDVRAYLVNHYDPARPEDVANFQDDVPPRSLRYDEIHQNNEGADVVTDWLKRHLDARGW